MSILKFIDKLFLFCLVMLLPTGFVIGQETIFPQNSNVSSSYIISSSEFQIIDTLTVLWTVHNGEEFGITNLYLADNLPVEFAILTSEMEIDGAPLTYLIYEAVPQQDVPMCNSFRWVIDDPPPDDSVNRTLGPGSTLVLEYKAVCSMAGNYVFPLHTLCCYGDNSGVFTTADTMIINVLPYSGVEEESEIPENYFAGSAYPNPFNNQVTIRYFLPHSGHLNLAIYNLMGQRIATVADEYQHAGQKSITWDASGYSSGIYFYRLAAGNNVFAGHMTALK